MCVVSMVMDHYTEKWNPLTPRIPGDGTGTGDWPSPLLPQDVFQPVVSPISAEEVAEFRRLLERAREYDKRMNEPDCELDSKRLALKKIAKQLGVDISFV